MADRPRTQDHKTKANAPRPLIEISTAENDEPDSIPLFSIDGEVYSMPGRVPPAVAIQALEIVADQGMEAAIPFMLKEALGSEGYQALRNCRAMTGAQLEAIMEVVQQHVMGSMDGARGN